jgi:hypothetical protein
MRTFDVYSHPSHGYIAIKQGFSWPALFFSWLWAFIKRMWRYEVGFLIAIDFLGIFAIIFEKEGSTAGTLLIVLLQIALAIFFAVKANE